jgi:Zn-dependent peptidase ImmA (M78 family)
MLQTRIPYLKSAEIDHAAAELLRNYATWRGSPARPPIDVDEIVEGYLKLVLEVIDLKALLGIPDVLGATWLDDGCIRIDQSLEDKEGRFAFTIAHEIAHWQLHRPLVATEKVTVPLFPIHPNAAPAPAIVCRNGDRKVPAEWQADQFAACLLMPAKTVQDTVRELGGAAHPILAGLEADLRKSGLNPRLRAFAAEVIEAGGFTNVSNAAMCYRLLELKLVTSTSRTQPSLF